MSRTLAYVGLVLGILAIVAGLSALFFDNFIGPMLDYGSSLYMLSTLFWFLNTLLVGLAVCFVAAAVIAVPKPKRRRTSTVPPTALPAAPIPQADTLSPESDSTGEPKGTPSPETN